MRASPHIVLSALVILISWKFHLQGEILMNKLLVALIFGFLGLNHAQAGQTDPEAMKKCDDEATAQGLVDETERKVFITQCLMRETEDGDGHKHQKSPANPDRG